MLVFAWIRSIRTPLGSHLRADNPRTQESRHREFECPSIWVCDGIGRVVYDVVVCSFNLFSICIYKSVYVQVCWGQVRLDRKLWGVIWGKNDVCLGRSLSPQHTQVLNEQVLAPVSCIWRITFRVYQVLKYWQGLFGRTAIEYTVYLR